MSSTDNRRVVVVIGISREDAHYHAVEHRLRQPDTLLLLERLDGQRWEGLRFDELHFTDRAHQAVRAAEDVMNTLYTLRHNAAKVGRIEEVNWP